MNQPQAYICPLPLEPLSHFSPHPTPLGYHSTPDLNSLHPAVNFHWLSNFIYGTVYVSLLLSQLIPPSPSHLHPSVCLYVCGSIASKHLFEQEAIVLVDQFTAAVKITINSVPSQKHLRLQFWRPESKRCLTGQKLRCAWAVLPQKAVEKNSLFCLFQLAIFFGQDISLCLQSPITTSSDPFLLPCFRHHIAFRLLCQISFCLILAIPCRAHFG